MSGGRPELPVSIGGHTANLPPVLQEIRDALRRLREAGEGTVIDLLAMPFGPGEAERLEALLGQGEVNATLDVLGQSRIRESACAGVWLVDHRNPEGERIAWQVEVTLLPAILATAPEELPAAEARLAELLDGAGPN